MKDELLAVNLELRSLGEKVQDGTMKADDAKARLDELRAQKRDIEQRMAQADAPTPGGGATMGDVGRAMMEKRAITLNDTGAIRQVRELAKELARKKRILDLVRYFYGPNASTNIPVLSPSLAVPGAFAEGARNIPHDDQARMFSKSITPHAFVSILPVSAETLALGSVDFEAELPAIFAEAFADGFARQVVQGDGTGLNFDGLFNGIVVDNRIQCVMAGGPRIQDFVTLALTLRDFTDDAIIVTHPTIYAGIMADSTAGVAELYKEELIRNKTIEGVSVLLTGYAPSSIAAGATIAVAARMRDYGFGLASQITIKPIDVVGDTNTYFQAMVFGNGTKIVDRNFYGLIAR